MYDEKLLINKQYFKGGNDTTRPKPSESQEESTESVK